MQNSHPTDFPHRSAPRHLATQRYPCHRLAAAQQENYYDNGKRDDEGFLIIALMVLIAFTKETLGTIDQLSFISVE